MTITDFLEDRISEDETEAREYQKYEDQISETAGWWDPSRVLAECAAKRAIIAALPESRAERGAEGNAVVEALAAVYADHPDYRQEWSTTNG